MQSQQTHKNTNLFLRGLFFVLFLLPFAIFAQKEYTVVLDAGHGGKDPGNTGNGYIEKNIALKVAKKVGAKLQKHKEVKVIFTRKTDVFIDLWKRGDIANNAKADLFVSIHCDSYTPKPYVHGAGTFVLGLRGNKKNLEIAKRENASILLEDNFEKRYRGFDPNSAESVIGLSLLQEENLDKSLSLASTIQNNFSYQLKRNDRKVKQDNFQVLRETIMPSVLVELGFLTNKKEGRFLNSKTGQEHMATAIANAIYKYIKNLQLNTVPEQENTKTITKELVIYKVQIASSKNKLATKPYNFKGLKNIERVLVGDYYKYYLGNSTSYQKIKLTQKEAKNKGFNSAFIVAFKEGKKISIKEALKLK
ncbi:N-acetylmuramoyl-L-alanine amidase [uncultured Polaribacter sp.]|uniref:N-acetylmuramoyl-L-alanine amidase family protein n=1 Tax=uncultured Polaribacter sp. TaxID=174711 RepID=UPI002617F363|nr:N-acetylmuramoyl-L-alanine amidase [uncultured Polaribacter sp.]